MATDLQRVSQLLDASLDPRQNKQAEIALRQEEQKPGFSLALLRIAAEDSSSNTTRLASALCFKNFIKRNWTDEDGKHRLPQNEVSAIKQEIIGLMIKCPPNIQSQLGDAVGIIADSDFFSKWDTLVDDLVSRLTPDDVVVNNGVLQVAHSIFKRWRPLFRSDDLFTEILHVLGKFGTPFLSLLENTDRLIEENKANKPMLKQLFVTLNLLIKLFYDLSCQEIPPVFEDNLQAITSLLQKYLLFDDAALHNEGEDEAGPLEFVKSGIFEALTLYVQKYEDAFGVFVELFVSTSWNLLNTTGPATKYDILVSKALQFLKSVTAVDQHAEAFNNEANMGQVIEKVILPNLTLRDSDMELFEDEPIEFIRRDLEGSDSDTRRRAATDLLRGLMGQYEKLVSDVVLQYVSHYLADYASNSEKNWRSKDTAVYLFSSIAAKGTITSREGVKTLNPNVNVIEFFQNNIANDLISEGAVHPILKVDSIKYIYTFRSQISKEQWRDVFPLLMRHLASTDFVVYSYAAIAVERVLALTDGNQQSIIGKDMVAPLAKDLLEHLFKLIEKDKNVEKTVAATKIQDNEFLMRCVMRILIVIREEVIPLSLGLLRHFVEITDIICMNPSNPRFCYYHFEAIGAIIRFAGPTQFAGIESLLFPTFRTIMQSDIQDFMPYVIQLFAALLEANPSATLPECYKSLVPSLVAIDIWLPKGNVPALARLLTSVISRGASEFVASDQIMPLLVIYQRLILIKTQEAYAFELLDTIFTSIPPSVLETYHDNIMRSLLLKLHNNKTDAFASRFVRFYHFISANTEQGLGTDFFVNLCEKVQAGMFAQLYPNIILLETPKLVRPLDRKTAVISFTKTLTDSVAFSEVYKKGWAHTCEYLLELLVNPPIAAPTDDSIADHDVEDMSFGVGFTQLTTIKKPIRDPWPEITNMKTWVGEYLKAADARQNGKIGGFVNERLTPEKKEQLVSYMQG